MRRRKGRVERMVIKSKSKTRSGSQDRNVSDPLTLIVYKKARGRGSKRAL